MNIRKIIREELEDFEWIENVPEIDWENVDAFDVDGIKFETKWNPTDTVLSLTTNPSHRTDYNNRPDMVYLYDVDRPMNNSNGQWFSLRQVAEYFKEGSWQVYRYDDTMNESDDFDWIENESIVDDLINNTEIDVKERIIQLPFIKTRITDTKYGSDERFKKRVLNVLRLRYNIFNEYIRNTYGHTKEESDEIIKQYMTKLGNNI